MAVVDCQVWNGQESSKVSLLTLRLRGITRAVGDEGGEVSYPAYLVLRHQKSSQFSDVEPSKRRASQSTVI